MTKDLSFLGERRFDWPCGNGARGKFQQKKPQENAHQFEKSAGEFGKSQAKSYQLTVSPKTRTMGGLRRSRPRRRAKQHRD